MGNKTKQINQPRPTFPWENGENYEAYIGRWSRLVGHEFLKWLAVKPSARWLDIGCGSGALSQSILKDTSPASVKGIDLSKTFIEYCKAQLLDPRTSFEVGNALAIPCETGSFDAAVSGLVLNFLPEANQAVAEMKRCVGPGGVVAVYVWDYGGEMQLLRYFWNAAVALDPAVYDLDEARRFSICHPTRLMDLFNNAGLYEVRVKAIEIRTEFKNFDDFWLPFQGGQGPAPAYLKTIDSRRRSTLREHIRKSLPVSIDGTIALVARAWAVSGIR